MVGKEKSIDPGLSAAERKALRGAEAKEAMTDHEEAQRSFHENRERPRAERLAREAVAGPMLYPAPELPDNTPIDNVRFSTRIRNAVAAAGWKTVGEIREASDETLLSLQDLGKGSISHLRETLGLPSKEGVRPSGPKTNKWAIWKKRKMPPANSTKSFTSWSSGPKSNAAYCGPLSFPNSNLLAPTSRQWSKSINPDRNNKRTD
jgi:hypothetical protein